MSYSMISSKENPLIKKVIKLATNSKFRAEMNQAVISGLKLIDEAQKQQVLDEILLSETAVEKYPDILRQKTLKVSLINKEVLAKINLVESDADIIGIINIKNSTITANIYNEDCVILERITDPGNLGTILRCSAATHIKNIILSENCVDYNNPKVLRSSAGAQFAVQVFAKVDIIDFISKYKGNVFATTPYTVKTIYDINYNKPTAWVFGNESFGISEELLAVATPVKIPMPGNAESLNVAMAATVCLFEMTRNRG